MFFTHYIISYHLISCVYPHVLFLLRFLVIEIHIIYVIFKDDDCYCSEWDIMVYAQVLYCTNATFH